MPDATTTDAVAGSATTARAPLDELALALADTVLAVPGVVRLEPTLSTAGPRLLLHRDSSDGVRITERGGVVDVDVSLATTATSEARAAAHQSQASITDVLAAHDYIRGAITVNVLSIDPG